MAEQIKARFTFYGPKWPKKCDIMCKENVCKNMIIISLKVVDKNFFHSFC